MREAISYSVLIRSTAVGTTPSGIRHIRDEVNAMGPGMPPKLTIFTVGERLTIQVEYDTAR